MAQTLPHLLMTRVWQLTRSTALAAALIALAQTAHAEIIVDYSQLPAVPVIAPPRPALTPEGYRQIIRLHSPLTRQSLQPAAAPVVSTRVPLILHPPAQKIVLIPPPVLDRSTAVSSTLATLEPQKTTRRIPSAKTQIALSTAPSKTVAPAELPQTIIQSPQHNQAQLTVPRAPMPITLIQWPMAGMLDPSGASNFPPVLPATPAQIIIEARVINGERRRGMHGAKPPLDAVAKLQNIPMLDPVSADTGNFVPPPMTVYDQGDVFAAGPAYSAPQPTTMIVNQQTINAQPEITATSPAITAASVYSAADGDPVPLPKTVIQSANTQHNYSVENVPLPRTTIYNPELPRLVNPPSSRPPLDTAADAPRPQAAIAPVIATRKMAVVAAPPITAAQPMVNGNVPAPHNIIASNVTVRKTVESLPAANILPANSDDVPAPLTRISAQPQPSVAPQPAVAEYAPARRTQIIAQSQYVAPLSPASPISYVGDANAPLPKTVIGNVAVKQKVAAVPPPQIVAAQENSAPPQATIVPLVATNTAVDAPILNTPVANPHTAITMASPPAAVAIPTIISASPTANIAPDLAVNAPAPNTQVVNLAKQMPAHEASSTVIRTNIVIDQPKTLIATDGLKNNNAASVAINRISEPNLTPKIPAAPVAPPATSIAKINAQIADSEASIAQLNQQLEAPPKPVKKVATTTPTRILAEPRTAIIAPAQTTPTPSKEVVSATPSLTAIEAQIAETEASVAAINQKLDADSMQAARAKPNTVVVAAPKKTEPDAAAHYAEIMARLQETESMLAKLKADNNRLNDQVTSQQVDQDAVQAEKATLLTRLNVAEQNLTALEQKRADISPAPELTTASQKSLNAAVEQRIAKTQTELKSIVPATDKTIGGSLPAAQVIQLPTMAEPAQPTIISRNGAATNTPVIARQTIQYASGATDLNASQGQVIASFANQLQQNPALQLTIRTYGSNGGAASDARRIALNRASILQTALKMRGVNSNQLQIQAIGIPPQAQLADQAELLIR